jgi:hypothetical protein
MVSSKSHPKAQDVKLETGPDSSFQYTLLKKTKKKTNSGTKLSHSTVFKEGKKRKKKNNKLTPSSILSHKPTSRQTSQPTDDFECPNIPTDIISHWIS